MTWKKKTLLYIKHPHRKPLTPPLNTEQQYLRWACKDTRLSSSKRQFMEVWPATTRLWIITNNLAETPCQSLIGCPVIEPLCLHFIFSALLLSIAWCCVFAVHCTCIPSKTNKDEKKKRTKGNVWFLFTAECNETCLHSKNAKLKPKVYLSNSTFYGNLYN